MIEFSTLFLSIMSMDWLMSGVYPFRSDWGSGFSCIWCNATYGATPVLCYTQIVFCALASGATCEFAGKFDPKSVWDAFARQSKKLTLFMAVPTIYCLYLPTRFFFVIH